MTTITDKQVEHLAELSALELTDEEKQKMKVDLSGILEFAGKVQSLDAEFEKTNERTASLDDLREDVAKPGLTNEEATMNAPKKENGCYVVSKVVD